MFPDEKEGGREGGGERERETERQRNINVREKYPSFASCMCPNQRSNLQPFGAQGDVPTN